MFAVLFAIVLIVAVANMTDERILPSLFYKLAGPVWQADNSASSASSDFFSYFRSKSTLNRENVLLNEQVSALRNKLVLLQESERQNEIMKELLGRGDGKNKIIFAAVLAAPPVSPYDILVIDAGSNQGLAAGNKVITSGGAVLGELENVYDNYSKVNLYSSPGKELSLLIGENRFAVEGRGVGGGAFEVILPKEEDVLVDDPVYLAGVEPLLVGKVDNIITRDIDFLKLVMISGAANIYELRYVGVVASSTTEFIN